MQQFIALQGQTFRHITPCETLLCCLLNLFPKQIFESYAYLSPQNIQDGNGPNWGWANSNQSQTPNSLLSTVGTQSKPSWSCPSVGVLAGHLCRVCGQQGGFPVVLTICSVGPCMVGSLWYGTLVEWLSMHNDIDELSGLASPVQQNLLGHFVSWTCGGKLPWAQAWIDSFPWLSVKQCSQKFFQETWWEKCVVLAPPNSQKEENL